MGRTMKALLFHSREEYQGYDGDWGDYHCQSSVEGQHGHDLGEFNQYADTLQALQDATRTLSARAMTTQDYLVLKFLTWIIWDCMDCGRQYVFIMNV